MLPLCCDLDAYVIIFVVSCHPPAIICQVHTAPARPASQPQSRPPLNQAYTENSLEAGQTERPETTRERKPTATSSPRQLFHNNSEEPPCGTRERETPMRNKRGRDAHSEGEDAHAEQERENPRKNDAHRYSHDVKSPLPRVAHRHEQGSRFDAFLHIL